MQEYERTGWRTCQNCVHDSICEKERQAKECNHHIYNADPNRYGDMQHLIDPIFEWLKCHYPNDTYIFIDKNKATIMIEHGGYFSKEIREFGCNEK